MTAQQDEADRQARTVAFLEEALGPEVERIDTHGAIVLLAGDRAFKMKRSVRFSFMDLSTLARREAAIRAELELNRRTAPQLYRRVLPVTREPDGGLALDGQGHPVEWLLEMARFEQAAQLDRVAARGELDRALVESLADVIARFHEAAEQHTQMGGTAAMREVIEGNAGDLRELEGEIFERSSVERLNDATGAELERHAALLDRRRAQGHVRRCHGDLHLRNIVLLDGVPTLFDCIEFSEEIGTIDVLYDLAFLLMDLMERGEREAAWQCLQRYGEQRIDDEGQALLPLFMSVRATVRAKVAGFARRTGTDENERRRLGEQAQAYLALALSLLEPPPPVLIAIGGRSGTGKSSVARSVAWRLGAAPGAFVLRSDVIRKQLFGRAPTDRLPPEAYSEEVSAKVFARIGERARHLLAAGRSVIADAVYGDPVKRRDLEAVAGRAGVPFQGIWLHGDEGVLMDRVRDRKGDASDADAEVVRKQRAIVPPQDWQWVRADRPLEEVAAETLRRVDGR